MAVVWEKWVSIIGDDATGTGTAALPWRTIVYALDQAIAAGLSGEGLIHVMPSATPYAEVGNQDMGGGAYPLFLRWAFADSAHMVTVQGEGALPSNTVVYGRDSATIGGAMYPSLFMCVKFNTVASWIKFKNLRFGCNPATTVPGAAQNLAVLIYAGASYALSGASTHHIYFEDCEIAGGTVAGVYATQATGTPTFVLCDNIWFTRCTITHSKTSATEGAVIICPQVSDDLGKIYTGGKIFTNFGFVDCDISGNNQGPAVTIAAVDELTFTGNYVHGTLNGGGNFSAKFGYGQTAGNIGTRLHATITDNYFDSLETHGVLFVANGSDANILFARNYSSSKGHSFVCKCARNIRAVSNYLVEVGVSAPNTLFHSEATGISLINNTLVSKTNGAYAFANDWNEATAGANTGLVFKNNLVIVGANTRLRRWISTYDNPPVNHREDGTTVCDYNAYDVSACALANRFGGMAQPSTTYADNLDSLAAVQAVEVGPGPGHVHFDLNSRARVATTEAPWVGMTTRGKARQSVSMYIPKRLPAGASRGAGDPSVLTDADLDFSGTPLLGGGLAPCGALVDPMPLPVLVAVMED